MFIICTFGYTQPAYAAEARELVPLGVIAGIKMETDGLITAGLTQIETEQGKMSPAKDAGIKEGDILISADGVRIDSIEKLKTAVDGSDGTLNMELLRDGKRVNVKVNVFAESGGDKKIGVLVKDSVLGIGTVTYYDPQTGCYGGLGHGVNDNSGNLIPLKCGELTGVRLNGIECGEKGSAGELKGDFTDETLGTMKLNTKGGVFGELSAEPAGKSIPVCGMGELKLGAAQIYSSVSGSVKAYDIRIRAIYHGDVLSGRDMLIEVTDPELIALTGGIVRGMSGSPIIQDGKLAGAVTHVLVNDPHKGYAISTEHMLSCSEETAKQAA